MLEKTFEQITVVNITKDCGLSRLAFYYHFQDKYELLNWIFYTEVVAPFKDGLEIKNWHIKLAGALKTMKDQEKYYRNAFEYDNIEFLKYLYTVAADIFNNAFDVTFGTDYDIKKSDREFITRFFSYGVQGTINDWVQRGMPDSPRTMTNRLKYLIEDSQNMALHRYLIAKVKSVDLEKTDITKEK